MANDGPKRRAMTPARKRRIRAAQAERHGEAEAALTCGNGACATLVPFDGPGVVYEHVITFHNAPHLDDDGPNVQAWCTGCSKAKNAKGADPTVIAKTKRQIGLRLDVPRAPAKMKSGGKLPGKGQGPKMKGRGFDGKHRPLRSRSSFRR